MHKVNWTYELPQSSFDLNDQENGDIEGCGLNMEQHNKDWRLPHSSGLNEDGNKVAGGRCWGRYLA